RIGDDSLFSEEQEREESFENSNITTALAPPLRHRDFITYDSRIYGIWYGENTTTGEYDQIEIIADGETTERISDIEGKLDGFFRLHDCVSKEVFTVGTITLSYTNETGDSITLTGTMDMQRKEHWDIVAVKPIAITNYANITIDGLGSLIGADNMGGADQMFFGGKIRSWPMLEEEYIPNLDEELYSQGQELEVGTMGIVQQPSEQIAEWMVPYDWEVEQGLIIHGYDTVKINVTSNMFDYLFYQKELWISSDMSFPVRVKDVINTSYESEDSTYYQYMTMENERTLKDSGSYKQGSTEVVWKGTLGEPAPQGHFLLQSPLAEFQPWYDNMMPVGGSNFEDSSFDISPEEAIEFAMNNSQVLQDFAANYSDAT
ncbi:MAG: hypothetical protein KAT70_09705, partial [Thermoplasmata archaeon]|nr:hypothetical protein [Thermoplasmata archaeon]